ncbi:MAG: (d)CMP kinase [Actinomycetota bacterium]
MSAIIAIDGPAGSGKSTLARRLAEALDLPYLNTGLMYRALAARALDCGVSPDDEQGLLDLLRTMRFDLAGEPRATLRVDGGAPGDDLVGAPVEAAVSAVARHPGVRGVMRDLQRALGRPGAVVEGRDIGSVVFPDATVKLFLVADEEARAARRRRERGGGDAGAAALTDRDRRDARVHAPVPPEGAEVLDTGRLDADATFAAAIARIRARIGATP